MLLERDPAPPRQAHGGTRSPPALNILTLSYLLLVIAAVARYFDGVIPVSTRNFVLSDIFLLLSLALLLVAPKGRAAFFTAAFRSPTTVPMIIFLGCGLLGLGVHASVPGVTPSTTIFATLQLGFVFFLLAPLVLVHTREFARLQTLWTVNIVMIAFAGLLSISDLVGLTHFSPPDSSREINPLLGVNGFSIFGLVSAFIITRILSKQRGGRLLYAALWTAGFAGVVLGGVRVGLILTLGSLMWVGRQYLRDVLRLRISARAVKRLLVAGALLSVMALVGATIVLQLPVFQTRVTQEGLEDAGTIVNRLDAIRIAWSDLSQYLLVGAGLNQFLSIHPEAPGVVHMHLLQALWETGVLGAAAWLWMFLATFRNAARWKKLAVRAGDEEGAAHWDASCYVILGAFIAGLVYPIGYTRVADWLLFLLATGPELPRGRTNRQVPEASEHSWVDPASV